MPPSELSNGAVPRERFWRRPLDAGRVPTLRGEVVVIDARCKGCQFCVEFCPLGVLSTSRRFNAKGYHPPDVSAPAACVACHLCERLCPEFAIFVREVPGRGLPPSGNGANGRDAARTAAVSV